MKAIFFSDAHLTNNTSARAQTLIDSVRTATRDADMVFILGDLFEFYHGFDGYIYPFYQDVADLLRELASRIPVYFLEGNHEFDMGRFFVSYTGVQCARSLDISLDGMRVSISHGDEYSSPLIRMIVKSSFVRWCMDTFGPRATWRVAMLCRIFLSKKHKPFDEKVRNKYRERARHRLETGYDVVIMAHSHIADFLEYSENGRKKTYMNTGDMVSAPTFGIYETGKGFSLRGGLK